MIVVDEFVHLFTTHLLSPNESVLNNPTLPPTRFKVARIRQVIQHSEGRALRVNGSMARLHQRQVSSCQTHHLAIAMPQMDSVLANDIQELCRTHAAIVLQGKLVCVCVGPGGCECCTFSECKQVHRSPETQH